MGDKMDARRTPEIMYVTRWRGPVTAEILRDLALPLTKQSAILRYTPCDLRPFFRIVEMYRLGSPPRFPVMLEDQIREVHVRLVKSPDPELPFEFGVRAWQDAELLDDIYTPPTLPGQDAVARLSARNLDHGTTLIAYRYADSFRLMPVTAGKIDKWSGLMRYKALADAAAALYLHLLWSLIEDDVFDVEPPTSLGEPPASEHESAVAVANPIADTPQGRGGRNRLPRDELVERLAAAVRIKRWLAANPGEPVKRAIRIIGFPWGKTPKSQLKLVYELRKLIEELSIDDPDGTLAEAQARASCDETKD